MLNFKTNIPAIDEENDILIKASAILEEMGNQPGLTADEFYRHLARSEYSTEELQAVTLAAISIETMMGFDAAQEPFKDHTAH